MEEQLVQLLASTQLSEQAPRQQAEIDLKRARTNPAFPVSLANVAAHASVDTAIRQSALSTLRIFIEKNWAAEELESEPQIPISDESRARLRNTLLEIALSAEGDRKVKISASYAIGKVAIHDFPDQWPELLPTVLAVVPSGNDAQLHGALRVLGDLIDESLSEDQFFSMAQDIAKALTHVALNENHKPMLRALAISVFRGCFELMNMVKEEHAKEVKAFASQLLAEWNPFFITVLKSRLPDAESAAGSQPESWNSIIALKLQVVKTLLKIRRVFPNLLLPQSTTFFTAVWEELTFLKVPYERLYIQDEAQSRLEDSDSLPYTLDLLILEEIDFLNQCFRAPPVQSELDGQLNAHASGHEVPWMMDIMNMLTAYSQVTREEEDLWNFDCSLYLAEETSVTAQYTARTAAGDLLIKMGEWFNDKAVDGLFGYTKSLFTGDNISWRAQEAALYLFSMLAMDFQDVNKDIPEAVASAYLELVDFCVNRSSEPLLKARGYLIAGILGRCFQPPPNLLDHITAAIANDDSEVVQVACIKAIEGLIDSGNVPAERQVPVIMAIQSYMNGKDHEELEDADELLVTLGETLRAAITLESSVVLSNTIPAIDLLFLLAKLGASNFQVTMLISEAFEEIVCNLSEAPSFGVLCGKVLPTLTEAFNSPNLAQNDPLITNGSGPLPEGFVAAVFPQLSRVLMESNEGEVLRPGSEAVKWMLVHDHQQVFNWQDGAGGSGLEVCLRIVDRLLSPAVEDNSAAEVGGLTAELVEKAGQERLGPFLPQLLQAVANRLATAQAAAFIQSLILVFARLSIKGASDVVEFLHQIQINGENGLQVVITKWLENSVSFAGYDEIRQNVIALANLYSLNDPRLVQVSVKGDLIVADDGMIKTRSRAKKSTLSDKHTNPSTSHILKRLHDQYMRENSTNPTPTSLDPDQYTIIPATLKIIKVLVEELLSASGARAAAAAAAMAGAEAGDNGGDDEDDDDSGSDEGWEDDEDILDLSLGVTKAELMSFGAEGNLRQRDDETQAFLTDFFMRCGRENVGGFQQWFELLSDDEKAKLNEVGQAAS
ncbi:Importin subunit beta-5 [Escovopsis weberi]|uniref:Importin subunit beta-5 n=1 Tax=Escovopsis weberi TaxID=150374 RepID=A0A0M9VXH5_ESCWE|nr:Importin subunit beta-5 [Escovopsis weberi]